MSNIQKGDLVPQPHGGAIAPAKPGEIRNPAGRKTLGAYVSECFNSLACQQPTRGELRRLIKDDVTPSNMRIAAVRYLRMQEHPDLADFEPVLDGQMSLREIRNEGTDTAVVKKVKVKRKKYKTGETETEEVEREIELHDRSGQDFDRVLDRTDGKPTQALEHTGTIDSVVKVIRGVSMDDI